MTRNLFGPTQGSWPNPQTTPSPKKNKQTNKRQICWVSATEPSWAFRSSWPAGVWIDIKNARKTSLWSLNRLNTRQVLSILLQHLPNQKTKQPITFCCTICSNFPVSPTQVLQSFVRSPSPIPAEKFPTDLGFWSLRSSPAKHPSDLLGKKFLAARCHQKKGDGGCHKINSYHGPSLKSKQKWRGVNFDWYPKSVWSRFVRLKPALFSLETTKPVGRFEETKAKRLCMDTSHQWTRILPCATHIRVAPAFPLSISCVKTKLQAINLTRLFKTFLPLHYANWFFWILILACCNP